MAYPSLAMLRQFLDAANRDLKGNGRLHHAHDAPWAKVRRNLYSFFIDQNANASRIVIVESALGLCNPSRARRAGTERVLAILVWVKRASFYLHQCPRLGVHNKTRSENFQGRQDTC